MLLLLEADNGEKYRGQFVKADVSLGWQTLHRCVDVDRARLLLVLADVS